MPRKQQVATKPISEIGDPRLVKAMAHPLRVRILRFLEDRTASPSEIAQRIQAPLANVSYHVRALARAGLIELTETAPRRGAVEHYYRAVGRIRVTDEAWAQVPAIVKAGLIDSTLQQIGEDATAAAANGGFEPAGTALLRQPLTLDAEGLTSLNQALLTLVDEAREISRQSEARMSDRQPDASDMQASLAVMLFEVLDVSS